MKAKDGIVRMVIEIPVYVLKAFKEEAKFRNTTIKRLVIQSVVEKMKRDYGRENEAIVLLSSRGYSTGVVYCKSVVEIRAEMHTVIKTEASKNRTSIKDYMITAMLEKMKSDNRYRVRKPKNSGGNDDFE